MTNVEMLVDPKVPQIVTHRRKAQEAVGILTVLGHLHNCQSW